MKRILLVVIIAILFSAIAVYAEDGAKEATYQRAIELLESGEYDLAASIFEMLGDYEDSAAQLVICRNAKSKEYYDRAVELFDAGEYDTAKEVFLMLGDYEDSAVQAIRCDTQKKQNQYNLALTLVDEGDYEHAKSVFILLGDFSDSKAQAEQMDQLMLERDYSAAKVLESEGKYEEAIVVYEALGDYSDAAIRLEYCERQIHIADLSESIETALSNSQFDSATVYNLLLEAGQYDEIDSAMLASWYNEAYDAETVMLYTNAPFLDADIDGDDKPERIVGTQNTIDILSKTEKGLSLITSVESQAVSDLKCELDPSQRLYLIVSTNRSICIYLMEKTPAIISEIETADDDPIIEFLPSGFTVSRTVTEKPLRVLKTEYIVISGEQYSVIDYPITVDLENYPAIDSAERLVSLYKEAILYSSEEEEALLVSGTADKGEIDQIDEWLQSHSNITQVNIVLWNRETEDYECVVKAGSDQITLRIVQNDDKQFQLLGIASY